MSEKAEENNPFGVKSSIKTKPEAEDSETQGATPVPLRSRRKDDVDEKMIRRTDEVALRTGYASYDERRASEKTRTHIKRNKTAGSEHLGARVGPEYLEFINRLCNERSQTKRVIVEECIDAWCEKNGLPKPTEVSYD